MSRSVEVSRKRRIPLPSRALLTWLYVVTLGVLAGLAWLLLTHGERPHSTPELPWWAVAAGFAGAEICVVHVRFRRSAHSFSLADVPFVFGLVFAAGDAFVLGALVGTGIVWGVFRRLAAVKLAFNLAQLALAASVAAGILQPDRRRRQRAGADHVGRPLRRHAVRRRADDPPARRRDRDLRGQPHAARRSRRCSRPTRS